MARSAEADWTGLGLLDAGFPYRCATDEILDLPKGHTTVSCKHPHYRDAPFICRVLPISAVPFAVDQLLWMDLIRAIIFGCDGILGSASGAMCSESQDEELNSCLDNGYAAGWYFADVSLDSHVEVRASLRRDFKAISKLCPSARFAVAEDAGSVFNLTLQKVNALAEHELVMNAKNAPLEHVGFVEETAGVSLAS